MLIAVLDANVLWSAPVRDCLLRAAELGLFQARWSAAIIEEFTSSLLRHRVGLTRAQVDRLTRSLADAFPEALVTGVESLNPVMTIEPKDRHVLAAAVLSGASYLVTWNTADFPLSACEPHGVIVIEPDEFLVMLMSLERDVMQRVITEQASDLKFPPMSRSELLENLMRLVPKFATLMIELAG